MIVALARFRFRGDLGRFLARAHRERSFVHACARAATLKNAIESLGVPHTEVGSVTVDGAPATLQRAVRDGDEVEVLPVAAEKGPDPFFLADAHLGGLARFLRMLGFDTLHQPENRDFIRFEMRNGKLRNLLDRCVPERAAEAVSALWARRGSRPVARVPVHPGGRDVLTALEPVLAPHHLGASARVLRTMGNMSSPSVLFVVADILREGVPADGDLWLASFGAGFAAHSCRLGKD